jgi:hypothetical protein
MRGQKLQELLIQPMQKTIPTIFLVFAVLFAAAGTSWGQGVEWGDLVKRDGLMYRPFTDVPFTGVTTGLSQYTIKNGILHGPRVMYWSNGQLWLKGNYKDGELHGPWVNYYENGQLKAKGNYVNGEKDGPWLVYSRDGVLNALFSGTYRNGEKVSD